MENINDIMSKNAEVAKIIEAREKKDKDKVFQKGLQKRIGINKYIAVVDELAYERRTGKNDGNTSILTPEEKQRLNQIGLKKEAELKKEIKNKELKEAAKKQSKGGSITKNRIGGNDYRKGGYVLNTMDNRKKKKI
tara:strand:- start:45 stop:452 length:408 start_codon:yes stop_codon:yes gene_type:complete